MIMLSRNRISGRNDVGEGLLKVAKELVYIQSSQHYSNEYSHQSVLLTTYIEVINELRKIRAVDAWMTEKKDELVWLEQYLQPDTTISDRSESSRRDDALHHGAYDQQYSDSDLNGLNESDDDDDSRFEDAYNTVPQGVVIVEGAGISQVNGTYTSAGMWDNVDLFTKTDCWEGVNQTFSLFRCRLSDNSKRWYISIVPENNNPGTSSDTDFYYQLATGNAREVPGMLNWVSARGSEADPPPIVKYQSDMGHSDHDSAEECDQ